MSLREEDHINVEGAQPMKEASPFVTGIETTCVDRDNRKSRHSKQYEKNHRRLSQGQKQGYWSLIETGTLAGSSLADEPGSNTT